MGPQTETAQALDAEKYRMKGETFEDKINRGAAALSDSEEHRKQIKGILGRQAYMPAGRVQLWAGSGLKTTPYNCYVMGAIDDSLVDGNQSIMKILEMAAKTMKMGGGVGYDFSTLRPNGDAIKSQDSQTPGPLPFMDVFSALCQCIASAGHRQGAQMAVLRVDHPDIQAFVNAKHDLSRLTGFNTSVGITDEFMQCVINDRDFPLRFGGKIYRYVNARDLWDQIMRSTYDYAEPGVLFIDRMNEMNNLQYCETISATNPCAEQPLPPWGACLLGSFNLTQYIAGGDSDPDLFNQGEKDYLFDWNQFKYDIAPVVRMMDNVIDQADYPLYEQQVEAKNKRRMGLGITGLANAAEILGMPYGTHEMVEFTDKVMRVLANEAYRASAYLAEEKGSFPLFDTDKYLESKYLENLDQSVRDLIREKGIRNSHLISVAPTGTISQTADNISSGIEPVFSIKQERTINQFEHARVEELQDYAYRFYGVEGKTSDKVTVDEHINVLLAASKWSDSAVSKTCNVPQDIEWEDFKEVYMKAYLGGAKGCTTFRPGGKRFGILVSTDEAEDQPEEKVEACFLDEFGQKSCA